MRYAITLLAAGLSLLLSPASARCQSTLSPEWVKHASVVDGGRELRPYGVTFLSGTVYTTGFANVSSGNAIFGNMNVRFDSSHAFIVAYDTFGNQRFVRGGSFSSLDPIWNHNTAGFDVSAGSDEIYTMEGFSYIYDADMLTYGGVSINKYSNDGTHRWTMSLFPPRASPGDQPGFALGLEIDDDGNLYTGGIYRDTLFLASDTLAPYPLEARRDIGDVFLASYGPDGEYRWGQRVGGSHMDVIAGWRDPHSAFTVDAAGNIFIGGYFGAGAVFGEGQSNEITLADSAYALASFESSGEVRWVRTGEDLAVSANAGPSRLAVDADGNLIVNWFILNNGMQEVTATVAGMTFVDPGYGGDFLTKISPDGQIIWARQIESDGHEWITPITTDENGGIYVGGTFDGLHLRLSEDIELIKKDLQTDREDGFIAHYGPDGTVLWAGHIAGESSQRVNAIAVSPAGDLYVAGEFMDTLRLGHEAFSTNGPGALEMFVAKYDAARITSAEQPPALPSDRPSVTVFPNPVSNDSRIQYRTSATGHVRIEAYDMLGRRVAILIDEVEPPGRHVIDFDTRGLTNGAYVLRLSTTDGHFSQPFILSK